MKKKDKLELADFVVIGAMKAGTSTLYQTLLSHPKIDLTKRKEANFFNSPIDEKRIEWYKQQFSNEENKLKGDISPNYSKSHSTPITAPQLYQHAPHAKIIFLARDPLKRIVSHLHHNMLRDRVSVKTDFQQLLSKDKDYILTSSYFYQLAPFKEVFPNEQLLVVSFEKMIKNKKRTILEINSFLGVDECIDLSLRSGNLTEKRYKIPYYDIVHNSINNRLLLKVYHLFWYIMNIKVPKPILADSTMQLIAEELQPDIERFCEEYPSLREDWNLYNKYSNPKTER